MVVVPPEFLCSFPEPPDRSPDAMGHPETEKPRNLCTKVYEKSYCR